jgi:ATP-dependent DNA helicase RecQ
MAHTHSGPSAPSAPSAASRPSPADIDRALHQVFGHARLRNGQAQVIQRVMAGQSTLAVMPTGAGKSLCYQLPAVLLAGRTVVVSPLIALMKDQCDKLRGLGIHAVQVNSALAADELAQAEQAIDDGSARIVLTTPERLAAPAFQQRLSAHPIALVAVDEAHCISQWGHDFRPAFLDIGPAIKALGSPPVLALTATASDDVAADVMKCLGIPRAGLVDTGAFRSNLHFAVEQMADEKARLARTVEWVRQEPGSGIVYAATVKAAQQAFEALRASDESVALYHGKLGARERSEAQEAFMAGTARVMVATNAFGMGIDKPDIRFVLHCQMPSSLHAYYQEAGRAGRDGLRARCVLLFHTRDRAVQQFFLAGKYPQLEDLDAIYRQLLAQPPQPHEHQQQPQQQRQPQLQGWTTAALLEALDRPRTKMQSGIALLRQEKVIKIDRRGHVALRQDPNAAIDFVPMLDAYKERRLQDRETLERMLSYAQSGQCRWHLLLDDLDPGMAMKRCGVCDNCQRIAAQEAAMAQPIVVGPGTASAASASASAAVVGGGGGGGASMAPSTRADRADRAAPAFAASDPVRVKRFGEGVVVAADAGSITVEFADGSRRCFHPDYVSRRRAARASLTRRAGPVAFASLPG